MALQLWDEKYTVNASGFDNTGVICYFNSMLQGLLSCTSLTQLFIEMKQEDQKKCNELATTYRAMIMEMRANPGRDISSWSPRIWNVFQTQLKSIEKGKGFKFGTQQEDVDEGLNLFIQALSLDSVSQLFEHRYKLVTFCDLCKKVCSKRNDEGICIDIHNSEIKADDPQAYQKYLIKHYPKLDDNFQCPECKRTGNKRQIRCLTMLPEIIILQFKKYKEKWTAEFPFAIEVPGSGGKVTYKLVSQTEHSGGENGGHYWARGLRSGGKVWMLNDRSIAQSEWSCTPVTYMAWYHASGVVVVPKS